MSKTAKRVNLAKHIVISIACILLVVIMAAGDAVAGAFYLVISNNLGQITYKVEEAPGGEAVDAQYYKSEFDYDQRALRAAQREFALQVQGEGAVLLKQGGLPIASGGGVTLLGAGCADNNEMGFLYGGGGSGGISTANALNLKEIFEQAGYAVNPAMWDYYNTGAGVGNRSLGNKRIGEQPLSSMPAGLRDVSGYGDIGIVVVSRPGAEGTDMPTTTEEDPDKSFLELSQNELDLIRFACEEAGFGQVVLLLNTMQAIELEGVLDYENLGILWVGGAGEEGAQAIPALLNGAVNPSGRLVDTWVNDMLENDPAVKNQGDMRWNSGDATGTYVVYQEGIYVGYRYYETRYADAVMGAANAGNYDYQSVVTYPFGYGLSYTAFDYSDYRLTEAEDSVTVSVKVTNSGGAAGREAVQIYMQSPYTQYDRDNDIEKEAVQLAGFSKTGMLEPGASETVEMTVPKEYMRAYDANGAGTYVVDAGDYYFAVGKNAHDALNNILAAQGFTAADGMTAEGSAALAGSITQAALDTAAYAAGEDDFAITNELSDINIQNYDPAFVYMTRKDWAGTVPTGTYELNVTDQMLTDNAVPDPKSDPDAVMPAMGAANGLALVDMRGLEYGHPLWETLLDQLTFQEMTGLLTANFSNAAVGSVMKPALTDSDGPAGITASLGVGAKGYGYGVEVLLASTWNKDLARRQGELVGEDSLFTMVSGWYAPACNIHRSAFSGRNFEYYSEDSLLSGVFAGTVVAGASEKGVYCYLKHFALNDQETNRVKINTFSNEQAARQIYLRPFEIAVRDYGCNTMMLSMNCIGMTWVGHHRNLLDNIVRGEWGFEGMINTDTQGNFGTDINDTAVWAGTDMFLSAQTLDETEVRGNPTMMNELREAAHHILYVTANSNGMNGISNSTRIVNITPPWVMWLIAANVTVIGGALAGLALNIRRTVRNMKKKEA